VPKRARSTGNLAGMLSMSQIADRIEGRLITPDDADYDRARTIFSGNFDRRPAVIVRPADDADVARVIALARETGSELAVKSGGHSGAGHSMSEGGIVLDLADMRRVDIDAEARTAWAEAGLSAGEYTVAAGAHGLATGFGDTGTVGIGGLTLAGGIGYLVRKLGMTIDALLAADLVTADGELLRVDEESHPDLFWAIRGGGGNLGVVTRFRYRLDPVDTIVGGILVLPATPSVIASFIAEAQAAPEELSTIANVMTAPPLPFLDPQYHGRPVVMGILAYAGDVEDGERVVGRFRALATPLADMVRPMPYPEIYPPEDESFHPISSSHNMFVDGFDEGTAEMILDRLESSSAMMRATQLRVLGGAMSRVPANATAFAHRAQPIMVNVAAVYGDPGERSVHDAWVADLAGRLGDGDGDSAAYSGFLTDGREERVRAAYPGPTWDRLAEIKARYDPDNVFRLNSNVPPAR
jgi:FAD/FMN-containing dehydrogenase